MADHHDGDASPQLVIFFDRVGRLRAGQTSATSVTTERPDGSNTITASFVARRRYVEAPPTPPCRRGEAPWSQR